MKAGSYLQRWARVSSCCCCYPVTMRSLSVVPQEPLLQLASSLWLCTVLVNCKSSVAQLWCLEEQSHVLCGEQGSWSTKHCVSAASPGSHWFGFSLKVFSETPHLVSPVSSPIRASFVLFHNSDQHTREHLLQFLSPNESALPLNRARLCGDSKGDHRCLTVPQLTVNHRCACASTASPPATEVLALLPA